MQTALIKSLAVNLIQTAQKAGRAEMDIYQQEFTVDQKSDDSPVTQADRLAEAIILEDLAKIAPDIPIIAEEAASKGQIPETGDLFFLVDPLDGTKEFIKKSREFTVNIALVDKGVPIFGLVYAPAIKQLYLTLARNSAIMAVLDPYAPTPTLDQLDLKPIATRAPSSDGLVILASKSHMTEQTRHYIEQYEIADLQSVGSSLKFCKLARGDADLYPRFGPTMEWDTAAGHAILNAAGGQVLTTKGVPIVYGKSDKNYNNPFFIAWGRKPKTP